MIRAFESFTNPVFFLWLKCFKCTEAEDSIRKQKSIYFYFLKI